jgi:CubicO group peptidase (beta-lactamase class C family)
VGRWKLKVSVKTLKQNKMKKLFIYAFALLSLNAFSQITSEQIDEVANKTLKAFNVPGIAVAVIKDGKVIHAKGYGVKSLQTNEPVDENTLFGIASNSKAFTTTALSILIDEGKLKWDDKVIQYLPDFMMYDPYVTKEFTIRDLVTHRCGLGLGSGDLMVWPDGTNFSTAELVHNLRYLKPTTGFRNNFNYNNVLYVTAGEIIAKISGKSWATFVQERIMNPVGMTNSVSYVGNLKENANVIDPHVPTDGKLVIIPRYANPIFDGAAGIYSNVTDMSKWALVQLNNGKLPDGKNLLSEKQQKELTQQQTVIAANTKAPYNTHFSGYGLGFFLSDVKGYKQVSHTGGLEGNVTQFTLIPELGLGIIVLTNQQTGGAFNAITNTIKDSYLGVEAKDYIKFYSDKEAETSKKDAKLLSEVWAIAKEETKFPYEGKYTENWFGEVELYVATGKYYFKASRSKNLKGQIFSYKDNQYIVKWNNRSLNADAFINFENKGEKMTIKPISELTDFSYDFQDLEFHKAKGGKGKK